MASTSKTSTLSLSSYLKLMCFIVLGWFFVILAILGVFLPLLPTTPFLLLAAFFFSRSSKRFHDWLINHPWFGDYIKNFQEGRGLTLKSKIVSVLMIWLSIGSTALLVVSAIWLKLLLLVIAVGVSSYLISRPTYIKDS